MPITKTSYSFPKNVLVYCISGKRSLSTWNGIARKRRRWTSSSQFSNIRWRTDGQPWCIHVWKIAFPWQQSIALLWMRGTAKTNTFTTRPCSYHQTPPKICQGQGNVSLPSISPVYIHTNQYCARNALPEFRPALCLLPDDLIPFPLHITI
jgi:hypothetical protein